MSLKLSVSILISSAYFLTLFIVKVLKTQNILSTVLLAGGYSVFLFLAIYLLLQYIEYAFEGLKRKESQDALAQIARIEKEFKMRQKQDLDDRLKRILEKDRLKALNEEYEDDDDYEDDEEYEDENDDYEDEREELRKLKRDSGTQFDSRFIEQGGPNI